MFLIKAISLLSRSLGYLPMSLRLADRFAARHCQARLPARWLALRGWSRALRAQLAHPELPLLGLIVYSYVLGELNASRRNHH